ncbi:MAG: hypothetical protein ACLQBQ_00450 [Smithella sp.]
MVSPNVKLVDIVINGKRQYAQMTVGKKMNPVTDSCGIFRNTAVENVSVVKMK